VFATSSCLLLVGSMLTSHEIALCYQRYHLLHPQQKLANNSSYVIGRHRATMYLSILRSVAVIARLSAKLLAVVNASWVLCWSLLSFSSVMDQPYCATAYLTLNRLGWMPLWNARPEYIIPTALEELGSVTAASSVAFCACIIIFNLTQDTKTTRNRWTVTIALLAGFFTTIGGLVFVGARSLTRRWAVVQGEH
jgi:hypothetical protein